LISFWCEPSYEIKVEIDLVPVADKESRKTISKAMPSANKGSMEILFGGNTHIHIRRHFAGGQIPAHAPRGSTFFNMLLLSGSKEGPMENTLSHLGNLSSNS
jgi:hypothetical protein